MKKRLQENHPGNIDTPITLTYLIPTRKVHNEIRCPFAAEATAPVYSFLVPDLMRGFFLAQLPSLSKMRISCDKPHARKHVDAHQCIASNTGH